MRERSGWVVRMRAVLSASAWAVVCFTSIHLRFRADVSLDISACFVDAKRWTNGTFVSMNGFHAAGHEVH